MEGKMIQQRGGEKKRTGVPNMTPMVDVVMCILIFFMLGSSFFVPEWMIRQSVPVEKGVGMEQPGMPAVRGRIVMEKGGGGETWVRVFGEKALGIEGDRAALEALIARKGAEISPEMQVVICPQGNVRYQDLIWVYEWCLKAQMRKVGFATAS